MFASFSSVNNAVRIGAGTSSRLCFQFIFSGECVKNF